MTLLSPTPWLVDPIDLHVPTPSGPPIELRLDDRSISWDRREIALDSITAVAYSARRRRRLLGRSSMERRISLWNVSLAPVTIGLGGGTRTRSFEAAHLGAYAAMTALIHAAVEPRLRSEILRRIASGEEVSLGPIRLDAHGLRHDGDFTSRWADLPAAALDGEQVVVTHRVECDRVRHLRIDMTTPNAVLLPELLGEAAVAFS